MEDLKSLLNRATPPSHLFPLVYVSLSFSILLLPDLAPVSFLFAVCLIRPYALWFCWLSDYSFVQMAKISVPGDSIWQKIVTLLLGKDEKIWNLFVNIIQIGSEADRLILTQPKTCGVYVCVSGMWWGAKNVKAKKSVCVCTPTHPVTTITL